MKLFMLKWKAMAQCYCKENVALKPQLQQVIWGESVVLKNNWKNAFIGIIIQLNVVVRERSGELTQVWYYSAQLIFHDNKMCLLTAGKKKNPTYVKLGD